MDLPKKEGITEGPRLLTNTSLKYSTISLSQTETLATLSEDNVLFTHVLLFSHGGWTRDPVADYVHEKNPKSVPKIVKIPWMTFYFPGQPKYVLNWQQLFVLPKDEWEPLYRYMLEVGAIDRARKLFRVVGAQQVPVPVDNCSINVVACVNIVAFIVDGNDRTVAFSPAPNKSLEVVVLPPRVEIVKTAERLFAGEKSPYVDIGNKTPKRKTKLKLE